MATIRAVTSYDNSTEDFDTYVERLVFYFEANDITNDKRVAVFISIMGAKTYGLLKSLLAPDKPTLKTFEDLTKVLKQHLSPAPLAIAERFRFHKLYYRHTDTDRTPSLYIYTDSPIQCLGFFRVSVEYKGQSDELDLYVTKDEGLPLFGREWIHVINLQINNISAKSFIQRSWHGAVLP